MKSISRLFLFISIIFLFSFCKDIDEIKRYKRITAAKIIGKGRTSRGDYTLKYSFKVKNKEYTDSDGLDLYKCKFETSFKGKYLPVVYSAINPENNLLLIIPAHYKEWGYEFPDSLSWILDCTTQSFWDY